MAERRILSGREICRILQEHGFVEIRRRGSHIVMQKRNAGTTTTTATTTVPVPDHAEVRAGTLRQSGLAKELFEALR